MYRAKPQTFSGPVIVEWPENESRIMVVLEDVHYMDSRGRIWTAPAGSRIDGASIPKAFWHMIGPPFIGRYRRASVIHDVYCKSETRPAQDVHDVFREMLIADRVSRRKAFVMFHAVDKFGPRW